MNCKEFEENLTLDLYGDLPPEQRAAYEAHLAGCVNCQAAREEVRGLHEVLAQRPRIEPSPDFLVECRQALVEALDRERLGWHGLIREWLPFLQLPRVAPTSPFMSATVKRPGQATRRTRRQGCCACS